MTRLMDFHRQQSLIGVSLNREISLVPVVACQRGMVACPVGARVCKQWQRNQSQAPLNQGREGFCVPEPSGWKGFFPSRDGDSTSRHGWR
jgi:hypothetical protein